VLGLVAAAQKLQVEWCTPLLIRFRLLPRNHLDGLTFGCVLFLASLFARQSDENKREKCRGACSPTCATAGAYFLEKSSLKDVNGVAYVNMAEVAEGALREDAAARDEVLPLVDAVADQVPYAVELLRRLRQCEGPVRPRPCPRLKPVFVREAAELDGAKAVD